MPTLPVRRAPGAIRAPKSQKNPPLNKKIAHNSLLRPLQRRHHFILTQHLKHGAENHQRRHKNLRPLRSDIDGRRPLGIRHRQDLFNQAVKLDGVILTKYDSAAKGGALLQIGRTLSLPVVFVCVGEKYEDIKPFDKDEFFTSLMGLE